MKIFSAGEVARMLDIPYYKLDYLERQGKILYANRTTSNQRFYTEEDLQKLQEVIKPEKDMDR